MAARSCTLSTGSKMTRPGIERSTPMSSMLICVPPLSSAEMPGSVPTIFTFCLAYAIEIAIWSQMRRDANGVKLSIHGLNP